jgi:putative acetyltransferase
MNNIPNINSIKIKNKNQCLFTGSFTILFLISQCVLIFSDSGTSCTRQKRVVLNKYISVFLELSHIMNVVLPTTLTLRQITAADNAAIAAVIRKVSAEYGLTADKGYTVADPNLDELFQVYSQPGAAYWVVEQHGLVVGGGGVAPLGCSEPDICELQKMYFLPTVRGKGMAKKLALIALDHAREQGFKHCYLETTAFLLEAIGLYEHLGFEHISEPLGCTGHVDCEVRMLKPL